MRDYYNRRIGNDEGPPQLLLAEVAAQLGAAYELAADQGCLQKSFGYHCVDAGPVAGEHGVDIRTQFYIDTGVRIPTSVRAFLEATDEIGFFTLIEFLFDHVAKPDESTGRYHNYSSCGWHFDCHSSEFDADTARAEWRAKVNRFLKFYGDGFALSEAGEIERITPQGFDALVVAAVPPQAGDANIAKVNNAVRVFRLGRSTREQRKQAVRELADVLEYYRSELKLHLPKEDERDLFNIVNNFAIRHHHKNQKDDYDDSLLAWMFYTNLATVRLVLERVHGGAVSPEGDTLQVDPAPNADGDFPF